MTALVPRSGGGIAQAQEASAKVPYDDGGGDYGRWLWLEVADRVQPLLEGEELAAYVYPTVVARRGDSYRQATDAWWSSDRVVVEVEATRPLRRLDTGKMASDGPWAGTVTVHRLAPCEVRHQTWQRRSTAQSAQSAEARETDDATDILPPPLAERVRGGLVESFLIREGRGKWTEEVVAYRIEKGRVTILNARRGPARKEALAGQTWHSRLVETTVVEVSRHDLGAAGLADPLAVGRGTQPAACGERETGTLMSSKTALTSRWPPRPSM